MRFQKKRETKRVILPQLEEYVYTNKDTYCCPKVEPQLLFDDIKPYDYMTPLKRMSEKSPEILYFQEALQSIRPMKSFQGGSKSKSKSKYYRSITRK